MKKPYRTASRLPEFERDIKKLGKRFRTLEEDLKVFTKVQLAAFHKLGIDNRGIERIAGIGIVEPELYKARKFACRSLKGPGSNSGIRVIYAYFPNDGRIEFVEIYFKGDQELENRERILARYRR